MEKIATHPNCTSPTPIWNEEEKKCEGCPEEKPVYSKGVCNSCPSDQPIFEDEECKGCPTETPLIVLGKCEACPE